MDNTNQIPPQETINNIPPPPPNTVIEPQPQQVLGSTSSPPAKSKKRTVTILILVLLPVAGVVAAWFVIVRDDKSIQSTNQQPAASNQSSQVVANSANCAYKPKKNYPENEGLYGIWRENANKVDFDVYLPCKFHKDFNLHELGIAGGDDNEVVNVFLTFNRPEPASGEDGLPDDSSFHIRKLPTQHQPPTQCVDMFSTTSSDVKTNTCTKAGDTTLGPVYKNDQGDLYLVVNNGLIIWTSPPYDDSGDVAPMLEILNSLQKVDPAKLEFFNGYK